jgi:hypothetical protein
LLIFAAFCLIGWYLDTPPERALARLEQFDANEVRGQPQTITMVNALAKRGVDLGENGSVIPRPKGKR